MNSLNELKLNWTGREVWKHIVDITPDEDNIPTHFKQLIIPRNFKVQSYNLKDLLKTDPDFKEYYESGADRYQWEDKRPYDLDLELVIVNGELLDGYSRASEILRGGREVTSAFVAVDKIDEQLILDEGFFSWLGDLFKNPKMKRELNKLADELVKVRIKIGTLKLEGDPVEELEAELKDKSDDYTTSSDYSSRDSIHDTKIEMLEQQEEDIIARMDLIGDENEKIAKYVSKVKLESRMKATEMLMKIADTQVKKVLAKLRQKDQKMINQTDKELMSMRESAMYESEETYSDYPAAAKANAKKAIEWKEKYGRDEVTGGTAVGWQRAHQLAKGEALSRDVVSRMAQFNRHRKNSKVAPEHKDEPWKDNGYIAWLIWGGDEGVDWAMKKMDQINKEESNENKTYTMKHLQLFEQFVGEAKSSKELASRILNALDDSAQLHTDYVPKEALDSIESALKKYKNLAGKDAKKAAKQIRINLEDIGILSNTFSPFDVELMIMNNLNENLNEGYIGAESIKQLANDINGELYVAQLKGKSVTVKATTTTKTWDDGVPVLKYMAREKSKPVTFEPGNPNKVMVVHDFAHGWWYFTDFRKWYGLHVSDGYYEPTDLPFKSMVVGESFSTVNEASSEEKEAKAILQDLLGEYDPWEIGEMTEDEAAETVSSYGHKGSKAKKISKILYDLASNGVFEATTSWSKMMKGVRAGGSGPWSLVAIENNKVVGQKIDIRIKDMLPAEFEAMRKEYPRAKIHIEDEGGMVVWNESMITESHFNPGDKVTCIKSGMTGEVVGSEGEGSSEIYTVKMENGETKEYSPSELKLSEANEAVSVETKRYMFAHGKQPKGTGLWAFSYNRNGDDTFFAPKTMSYADAKKWATEQAKQAGKTTVYVMESAENLIKTAINEGRSASREEVMNWLMNDMKFDFVRTTEEFSGSKGGIWISGENGDMMGNDRIYNYYASGSKYQFGVLKRFESKLNKMGWYSEWNDAGTVMIWPL